VILLHALSEIVEKSQAVLGFGVSLVGGKPVPFGRFVIILQADQSSIEHKSQLKLGSGISPLLRIDHPFLEGVGEGSFLGGLHPRFKIRLRMGCRKRRPQKYAEEEHPFHEGEDFPGRG